MKLSLSQLKDLHREQGRRPLGIAVKGHIDLVVRNEDGSIDQIVSKDNLATSLWNDVWLFGFQDLRSLNLFILPDDNGTMNQFKTAGRHLYSGQYEVNSSASVNTSTSTWTYTGVLGSPTGIPAGTARSVRYIGLKTSNPEGTESNTRYAQYIFAMTRMTSDITQSTTQTLEIVYRVSFSRV